MTRICRFWPVLGLAGLMLAAGCSAMFVSNVREIKVLSSNFAANLNNGDWKGAGRMLHPEDFVWIHDGQTVKRQSREHFLQSIKTIASRSAVFIIPTKVAEINKTTVVLSGHMQVRTSTATMLVNLRWGVLLTWKYDKNQWLLTEIKETTPRERITGD